MPGPVLDPENKTVNRTEGGCPQIWRDSAPERMGPNEASVERGTCFLRRTNRASRTLEVFISHTNTHARMYLIFSLGGRNSKTKSE